MNQTLLSATWRVETMVGRDDNMHAIRHAIFDDLEDKRCRVVIVKGPGGIGKSRFLEEIQWCVGHAQTREGAKQFQASQQRPREDWSRLGRVVISDVIDLMDIRLSARTHMLQALRDALSWQEGVDFSRYEAAMRSALRALEGSADFTMIKSRAEEAEKAFWQAFEEQAEQQRFVLVFDTAERLILRSSRWLLDRKLLSDKELRELSSQQWLLWQLKERRFQNTILIVAGRDGIDEGGLLFDQIRNIADGSEAPCTLVEIELGPLSVDDTAEYFRFAANEWAERAEDSVNKTSEYGSEYIRLNQKMQDLVSDADRLKVLHVVTGGRPVLLSLYGDLVHEPDAMPELLKLTNDEILMEIDKRGKEAVQSEIERSFISLLFQKPGLRSRIMQALARCPAGLDAEQLHFVIDGTANENLSDWEPNRIQVDEIRTQLDHIRRLSIARPRLGDRLGLQDEIYRIYAQRMSDDSEELRTHEQGARLRQYQKLSQWAEHKLEEYRAKRRKYQHEDERRLASAIHSPTVALRPYLPSFTPFEQEDRSQIQRVIRDWELERLHYDLLRDPNHGLNDSYTDLAEGRWLSNVEEAEFITQQEMWRVLHDPYALRFADLSSSQLNVLQRAANDEDPARWIKRFVLRRDYKRAVELWQGVEVAVLQEDQDAQRTLSHPLNKGERIIWKCYAQIMQGGPSITEVVDELKDQLETLKAMADTSKDEPVGPSGETGFIGHEALPRLHRIIAVGYNFAGYGRVVVGQYGKGVGNYARSLLYLRKTKFEARQAVVRNNLGRALASLGRDERGYRVCADALALRRDLGAEVPIAYSLNTLALIGNGMQRTPTAWREAAQAAAIFRRAGENRGLGLALIQLGIGLRRLANSYEPTVILEATPDELFDIAQRAVGEAVDIFEGDPEVLRLVEARLEFACILRDQMRLSSVKSYPARVNRFHRDSEIEFGRAIQMANERGFKHLALQAQVDLAWAHYYAGQLNAAEKAASRVREGIDPQYLVRFGDFSTHAIKDHHVFYQLAKIYGLYAAVAMRHFKERREQLRRYAVDNSSKGLYEKLETDPEARTHMAASAEAYVLSLIYGQLYSPRSRSLVITFDQIYDDLKEFNMVEYRMFRQAERRANEDLREDKPEGAALGNIPAYDFSNLDAWLEDCFGPLELRDE